MKKKIIIGLVIIYIMMIDVIIENDAPLLFAVLMTAIYTALLVLFIIGILVQNPNKKNK